MYRYLIILTFLVVSASGFSQNNKDMSISDQVSKLYVLNLKDADEIFERGQKILRIARSKKERVFGYFMLADALYKKERYSESLRYYKKTDSIQAELGDKPRFINHFFITDIYLKVGLLVKAKESLKEVLLHTDKIDEPLVKDLIVQQQAVFLEEIYDYCGAIPMRENNVLFSEKLYIEKPIELINKNVLIYAYNMLIFDYLKCGRDKEAKHYSNKLDQIVDNTLPDKLDLDYLYYLNKAIFYIENHQIKQSKLWFDKALKAAEESKQNYMIKISLEERINYNIDSGASRKVYIKKLNQLKNNARIEANKIISSEEKSKNDLIKSRYNPLLIVSIILILVAAGVLIFLFSKERNYAKMINKIDAEDQAGNVNLTEERQDKQRFISGDSGSPNSEMAIHYKSEQLTIPQKLLSKEKEEELLSKLMEFEEGTEFTEKNFTISTMVMLFETNPKYINYLLQQHRGKLFSDYINTLRIRYLCQILESKPEYRNYKISYLSDLAGYSSHSRFASIFKKEMGVSPSEFISKLSDVKY
ncbi:helix-turn-helix domain-containing protein [Epilithonimonas zeae]|uniref:helix-turn-helix domain-containing protein n=1 Tax=Epilithonimonas zeae TaxID=1416779 RepID=UPI00200E4CCB|nr:helix-turn-helix domain-containing protein [Epilithonimonas zeae]UQB69822.1 helix-turn-helix domain-containing protein [Epilithonimonas zeae]